jgi:hypothetical protein
MTRIGGRSFKTKQKIAAEIRNYHLQVETALENLKNNGTITAIEYDALTEVFANVEKYLREKDDVVDTEVTRMGDENYIPWSELCRIRDNSDYAEKNTMPKFLSVV